MQLIWIIVVVLVALWLLGMVSSIGGGLIHLLIVIAIILIAYSLLTGRGTRL